MILNTKTKEITIEEPVTVLEIVDFMKEHNLDEKEWKVIGNLNSRHTEIFPIYPSYPITSPSIPWKHEDWIVYCTQ